MNNVVEQPALTVAGDDQMDSPGHTAKYCQYTVIDTSTGYVLDSQLVAKRETGGASATMELFGLMRCLVFLVGRNVTIRECVTDQHVSIKKFFDKLNSHCLYLPGSSRI